MLTSTGEDRRLARRFFLGGLLLATALFLYTVRLFVVPVLLAAVFATLFFPAYSGLLRLLRQRRAIAAFVCCLLLLLGLLLPLYLIVALMANEAVETYARIETSVRQLIEQPNAGLLHDIQEAPWFRTLGLSRVDWSEALQSAAQSTGTFLGELLTKTSKGTLQALITLGVTFFTMFYFFLDGERMVERLKYLSPLREEHESAIIDRFASVARATVRGTLVVALVQGALGGLTLWACGVRSPALWGAVMIVLAFIPLIGVKLVLVPAGIGQMASGHVGEGVAILLISFVVILNVDSVLRPRLVGSGARMHDLLVFFSTIGGLATFGITGIIVGPVIAAFFLALVEIYGTEFRQDLERAGPPDPARAPSPAGRSETTPNPGASRLPRPVPGPAPSDVAEAETSSVVP